MDYITTTELRKKSSKLVETVKEGESVYLVHRSEIIGKIIPYKKKERKVFNKARFLKNLAKYPKLPYLSYDEREKNYRDAMEEKHGGR